MSEWPHTSVMLEESIEALAPREGEIFVDCTVGMGGHTEALLEAAGCRVIGLDRDPSALEIAGRRLARFGDRVQLHHSAFGNLGEVLDGMGVVGVHGVLADLGVSSLQLDEPERGFSFRHPAPVDMRMDTTRGQTAADLVNHWDASSLQECIASNGEERFARRIAQAIVRGRPWNDTVQLAEAIASAIPGRARHKQRIHPATRTFQALRIQVNDELGEIERLLPLAVERLLPGGRLAFIAFHSLEDRLVKRFLARESGRGTPRDPYGNPVVPPRLKSRSRPIKPSPSDPNPRARSARLRTAERLS